MHGKDNTIEEDKNGPRNHKIMKKNREQRNMKIMLQVC